MSEELERLYAQNVERRRALRIPGYVTLAEAGFDGEYVTPYQIASRSMTGPVLVAKDWFDAPSALENQVLLSKTGYMPGIPFNNVLDLALSHASLKRSNLYVTQAFHLLTPRRSAYIPPRHIDESFDGVTKYELEGRRVIALGDDAYRACRRHGVECVGVIHPSARTGSYEDRARQIAKALVGNLAV